MKPIALLIFLMIIPPIKTALMLRCGLNLHEQTISVKPRKQAADYFCARGHDNGGSHDGDGSVDDGDDDGDGGRSGYR